MSIIQSFRCDSQPVQPMFEPMESRLMMSGSVSVDVVRGSLILTGGTERDEIVVDQAGLEADQFRIRGTSGTKVNGLDEVIVSGVVDNIRAELGDGWDYLRLDNCDIAGDFIYNAGGDESDSISISGHVAGDLKVDAGDCVLNCGMHGLTLDGQAVFKGSCIEVDAFNCSLGSILMTAHHSSLWLHYGVQVNGDICITASKPDATIGGTIVHGDLSVTSNSTSASVLVNSGSKVDGMVTVVQRPKSPTDAGEGVRVRIADAVLGGLSVQVEGGLIPFGGMSIPEVVPVYAVSDITLEDSQFLGNVDVSTDGGYEDVELSGCVFEGDVSVATGGALDTITNSDCQFLGSQSLTLGTGEDTPRVPPHVTYGYPWPDYPIVIDVPSVPISTPLDPAIARVVDGWLVICGTAGKDHFRITMGESLVYPSPFLVELIDNSPGDHVPTSTWFTGVTKGIRVDLGSGDDLLEIIGCAVPGDVLVTGGAGDDSLVLQHTTVDGRLVFQGGAGDDSLSVSDSTVVGLLRVLDLRGATSLSLANCTVGDLRIHTAGQTTVSFDTVTVGGNVKLLGGRFDDTITAKGTKFNGSVRVRTGGGADHVTVDSLLDSFPSDKAMRISLGRGDDSFKVEQAIGTDVGEVPTGRRIVRSITGNRGHDKMNVTCADDFTKIKGMLRSFSASPYDNFTGVSISWFGGLWPHGGSVSVSADGVRIHTYCGAEDGHTQLDQAALADLVDAVAKAHINADRTYGHGHTSDGYTYNLTYNGFTVTWEDGSELDPAFIRLATALGFAPLPIFLHDIEDTPIGIS